MLTQQRPAHSKGTAVVTTCRAPEGHIPEAQWVWLGRPRVVSSGEAGGGSRSETPL